MTVNSGERFEMVAKTFSGLEEVLAGEIRNHGGTDIEILNRAVRFHGDLMILYKMNLYLRTALRILTPVIQTTIKNQVDLYARVREYEWEKHIQPGMTMVVESFTNSSVFTNTQFISLRTKDAIVDRLREKYNRRPSVSKTNPDLYVNVHLASNNLTVSLDTSGQSLHKRGYRTGNFEAPLSEVLAAGLIMLSGWNGDREFHDPMCGSGTLAIEAALIARDIPPGIFRKEFAFEKSPTFNKELLENIYDNIQEKSWSGTIFSSDISKQAMQIAMKNAKQASVFKNISFRGIDFMDYPKVEPDAVAIINPPYGQRLIQPEIVNFYKSLGNVVKKSFEGSDVWVLSGNLEAMKFIGLKPGTKYTLYNGALECRYNLYTAYKGSRKSKYNVH